MGLGVIFERNIDRSREQAVYQAEPPASFEREDDRVLCAWWDGRARSGLEARRKEEPKWRLSEEYVRGNQNVTFSPQEWRIVTADEDIRPDERMGKPRIRAIHNKILPKVKIAVHKFIRGDTYWGAVPNTMEPEDIDSAAAATKYLTYEYFRQRMKEKELHLSLRAVTYSTAYLKVWWNYWGGRLMDEVDERGDARRRYEGDIVTTVVSPFQVLFDPDAIDVMALPVEGGPRWMMHTRSRTVADAQREARALGITSAAILDQIRAGGGHQQDVFQQQRGAYKSVLTDSDLVTWTECYYAPDPAHPWGGFVVKCGGAIIVKSDRLPYDYLLKPNAYPFPLIPFVYNPDPGSPYGIGMVWNIISAQRQWNTIFSMALSLQQRFGKGWWTIVRGALAPGSKFDPATDDVLEVNHAANIPQLQLPRGFPNPAPLLSLIQLAMNDSSGIHEITEGKIPATDISGIALQQLAERDDAQFDVALRLWDESMELVGQAMLGLAQQFYAEPRMVRVIGSDNQTQVSAFKGTDFLGADVRVLPRESRVESKAIRDAIDMQLFDKQVFLALTGGNPVAAAKLLMRRMGRTDVIKEAEQVMKEMAQGMMVPGEPPLPSLNGAPAPMNPMLSGAA